MTSSNQSLIFTISYLFYNDIVILDTDLHYTVYYQD